MKLSQAKESFFLVEGFYFEKCSLRAVLVPPSSFLYRCNDTSIILSWNLSPKTITRRKNAHKFLLENIFFLEKTIALLACGETNFSWRTSGEISKIKKILNTEAAVRRYSVKKVLLEISQNSQENTCLRTPFSIEHLW